MCEVCFDKEKGKEKLEEDEVVVVSIMVVLVFFMLFIWDKIILYDGEFFYLEYMDLDEFLLENGIFVSFIYLVYNLLLFVVELEGKEFVSFFIVFLLFFFIVIF